MRVFNIRLAAILLSIVAVFGIGVFFLHGFQVKRNASFFLNEAREAQDRAAEAAKAKDAELERKASKDAVNYLGWYVQLNPNDVDAMEELGTTLADRAYQGEAVQDWRSFQKALNLLDTAVRLDPQRSDARRRLVKMSLRIGRYQDAKQHLQGYLLVDAPKDSDLLQQLGECQAGTGDSKAARDSFKKAIEAKPAQLIAYVHLAELLRYRFQKPEEADDWMEKLVRVNPKSYKAHLLRARYLSDSKVGQSDEAMSEAAEALRLAPDDADALILTASCNMAKKQYDKARECATHGVKVHPDNVFMYMLLSEIELREGKRDNAIAVHEQGLKATNRDPRLLSNLANLLIDARKLEEVKKIIEELQKTGISRPSIDFLNARLEFAQEHWLLARQRLEGVRGAMVSQPGILKQIDFWLSQCYGQLGDRDGQERALRQALHTDPSFGPARDALASLMIAVRGGSAEDLVDVNPTGAIQRARVLLLKISQQAPADRDWQPLEKTLAEAEKATPDAAEIPLLRANMLVVQKRVADAEALLLEARDKTPKQAAYWATLVMLADREEDGKKAEALLEESLKALGDSVEQRLIQAQHLVRRRQKDTAERLRKLAENAEQFSEPARLGLWSGLLSAAIQVEDTQQANALAQKIAAKQPTNVQVRSLILDRAIASGDPAAIEKALDDIKLVAGEDSLYWLYGRAVLLYLQSKDSEDPTRMLKAALGHLERARAFRKDWVRLPLAEATVYDRLGDTNAALQRYREAIELGERNPNVIQRTIQILYQTRQIAEADRLLRRFEAENVALPPLLLRAKAEGALQMGDTARAVATARKAVSADSKDSKDHLWLGHILAVVGVQAKNQGKTQGVGELLADAETSLRRAVELEPKAPDAWVALVQLLKEIGADDKIDATIQDAGKNVPAKDAPLALARCYDVANKLEEAQKKYEEAQKAAPQDIGIARTLAGFYRRAGKLAPAEVQLQRILDGTVQAKETDIVSARRQLANILILRRNYKSFQKAESLIEENLAGAEASVIDRSLLARLKASDPKQGERDEAIKILEGLIASHSATPEDILELVKILRGAGNWADASSLLRDLVAANDKEPGYLAVYIEALLQHNDISSAEGYFTRLEKLAPNFFATASLKADLLCAANQQQQAFEVLKRFVDRTDAQPRDRGTRLRVVAEKIDRLGRQMTKADQAALASQFAAYAESLYRTYVKENPDHGLVLAVFLGTRGKVDEALDILDKSLPNANVSNFSQACALIVEGGKANKEQMQRLDKIIQSGMKKFEQPASLLLATAELRTRQEQFAEAADIYRKVLEKSPDNVMALNNLAVLQALQGAQLDDALKMADQAIEVAGPLGAMLDSRATVYMAMNNSEKALEDIKAAVADQETPVRLFHLAQAHSLAGDAKSAKAAFEQALKKGLTKELLQPLEFPTFESLRQLQR